MRPWEFFASHRIQHVKGSYQNVSRGYMGHGHGRAAGIMYLAWRPFIADHTGTSALQTAELRFPATQPPNLALLQLRLYTTQVCIGVDSVVKSKLPCGGCVEGWVCGGDCRMYQPATIAADHILAAQLSSSAL